jgi:hypothetical protein
MHSPLCLSLYYYIFHLLNLYRVLHLSFSEMHGGPVLYALLKERVKQYAVSFRKN